MAKHRNKKKPAASPVGPVPPAHRGPAGWDPEAEVRRGFIAFQRGDYGEAIQAWQRVHRAAPSPARDRALAEAHFRRALAAANPAQRLQDLQAAVTLLPSSAVYHLHLGLVHHRMGQASRALAALEAAHRLAPEDNRIRRHLALLLLAAPATAARVDDLFAGLPGRDEVAARLRALAALRSKQPGAAVGMLKGRPSLTPLARLTLGLVHLAAGETPAAVAALAGLRRSRQLRGAEVDQTAALALLLAYLHSGGLEKALHVLRQQTTPDDAGLRRAFAAAARRLGAALVLDDQIEHAVLAYQQALALEPKDTAVRRCAGHLQEVLGTRAAREGDMGRAAGHWAAALRLQPDNPRLLHNLALAEERLERRQQASAHWEEVVRLWRRESGASRRSDAAAVERRRRLAVAYRHLAAAQEAAGDVRAAARTLDHALNFDSSDVDLRLHAAALHMETEDYSSAVDQLRRALTARPDDIQILVELGSACTLQGDHRQAVTHLQQAQALEPGNPAVAGALAEAHHDRGHELESGRRWEQAAGEFERAASLALDDPEHLKCLGGVYLALGRSADARAAFDRAVALHPGSAVLQVAIGERYLERGRRKEAEQFFWQALRLDRSPSVQVMVGITYLENGDLAGATRYFKGLLKTRDPGLMLVIGRALLERHHEAAAIPYLERAVALDRSDPSLRLSLALAYAFGWGDYRRAESELIDAEALAHVQDNRETLAAVAAARRLLEMSGNAGQAPGRLVLEGAHI